MGPLRGGIARFKDWNNANLVFDGNSLVAGQGAVYAEDKVSRLLGLLPPLNSTLDRIQNSGVSGQSFAQMRTRVYQAVNQYYVPGKKNILFVWEGTNSICNESRTDVQAIADFTGYCSDVRAGHSDWYIIGLTTLPRGGIISTYTVAQANAYLDGFNVLLKANFRAIGCDAVVDVRLPGSPFALAGYTTADFNSQPFSSNMDSDKVHGNDTGYDAVSRMCAAQGLMKMRAR